MKFTEETKRCQRCRNIRTDFTGARKSCDRCMEQVSAYQKRNLELTRSRRTKTARAWRKTEEGKASTKRTNEAQKAKTPAERYQARYAVLKARRAKEISPLPCVVCGAEKVHAHHHDYSKPLDVTWLCSQHHREVHYA